MNTAEQLPPVQSRSCYHVAWSKGKRQKTKQLDSFKSYDLNEAAKVLETRWNEQRRGLWDWVDSWVVVELVA